MYRFQLFGYGPLVKGNSDVCSSRHGIKEEVREWTGEGCIDTDTGVRRECYEFGVL